MPWRVGIDEAGYGPHLGPLVMTAVACRTPEDLADANLWRVLRKAVRRQMERGRRRLPVDDSKLVYSSARGLEELESSVLSILLGASEALPETVAHLVHSLHPHHELCGEAWYCGVTPLPITISAEIVADGARRFRAAATTAAVVFPLFRSVIVCPPRFNTLLERWGSKGAILSLGLTQLLSAIQTLEPVEAVTIVVDKHGGRNHYGAVLQEAFPDGWALPVEEGMDCSSYVIQGLDRDVRVSFRPRADSGYFEVALASMISKYVREALMTEFNGFWKRHIPDLEPTAGYPADSHRFFRAIRPTLQRLNIAEELVWRKW
jgi:ribonuclease HII